MVYVALLGCVAAGLAWSATAYAEESPGQPAAAVRAPEAVTAAPKVRRPVRKVAVLPPVRPEANETAPLPTADAPVVDAAPAPQGFARVTSLAAVPPLRSSFQVEPATAAAIEPAVPAGAPAPIESAASAPIDVRQVEVRVVVPPPRPDFEELAAPAMTIVAVLPPERPAFPADASLAPAEPTLATPAPAPEPAPAQPRSLFGALFGRPSQQPAPAAQPIIRTGHDFLDERIAHHAVLNDVPAALVHRVVVRESKYNPRAVGRGGALGLMQIKHATARGLGYGGPAAGLLDAETNLTYAVKYLAGAYRLADGNHDRAVQHYARGYYYEAKRRNARVALRSRNERVQRQADAAAALAQGGEPQPAPRSLFVNTQ